MNFKYVIPAVLLGGAVSIFALAYAGSDHGHDHDENGHGEEAHEHGADHGDMHDESHDAAHDQGEHGHAEDHGHEDDHDHAAGHQDYETAAQAWAGLNAAVGKAEMAMNGEAEVDLHEVEEALKASIHYLEDHAAVEDAEKQARISAALGQLSRTVGQFHEATHDGFGADAERELKKLKGGVRLLEALYPAQMLSDGAN